MPGGALVAVAGSHDQRGAVGDAAAGVAMRRDLWAMFHRLAADGASLLVSSHVMDEAVRCDHMLFMREGRFLAAASPDEILAATGAADLEAAFLALASLRQAVRP